MSSMILSPSPIHTRISHTGIRQNRPRHTPLYKMSQNKLQVNGLYILLYIRSSPPAVDDFHWALYLHQDPSTGGTKYHIHNQGSGWVAGHSTVTDVTSQLLLVGAMHIADVPFGWENGVDDKLRKYDGELNEPRTTSKTWLFKVLELLKEEERGFRVLRCKELVGLEREALDWGNRYAKETHANVQPRPIGASALCGL